jgi:hypothetical protein
MLTEVDCAKLEPGGAPEAGCFASGTRGEDDPSPDAGSGLEAGQSSSLPAPIEDDAYRTKISVVNMGEANATVLVDLYDGAGARLTDDTVRLARGRWRQETQPFRNLACETAMSSGHARITVERGSSVFAFASVIDNATGDPATVPLEAQ